MTQTEVEKLLIDAICAVQELSGRAPTQVSRDTCPLLEVPEFDSLNGVEVTVEALAGLNLGKVKFNNVLADGDKPLTVAQAAARLLECKRERGSK